MLVVKPLSSVSSRPPSSTTRTTTTTTTTTYFYDLIGGNLTSEAASPALPAGSTLVGPPGEILLTRHGTALYGWYRLLSTPSSKQHQSERSTAAPANASAATPPSARSSATPWTALNFPAASIQWPFSQAALELGIHVDPSYNSDFARKCYCLHTLFHLPPCAPAHLPPAHLPPVCCPTIPVRCRCIGATRQHPPCIPTRNPFESSMHKPLH